MTSTSQAQSGGRSGRIVVAALVCGLAGAGCSTRPRPAMTPVPVALNVPPPPPRVISTPPEPVAPTEATTVERPAPASRPARSSRAANGRGEATRPAVEPPRADAPAEPATPAAAEAPSPSTPLLRTPQTADESEAERRTRDVLNRASTLLSRVNAASLAQQARQQHETARRFVAQAEQALMERNYVLASYLADKAETLAKGLSR